MAHAECVELMSTLEVGLMGSQRGAGPLRVAQRGLYAPSARGWLQPLWVSLPHSHLHTIRLDFLPTPLPPNLFLTPFY